MKSKPGRLRLSRRFSSRLPMKGSMKLRMQQTSVWRRYVLTGWSRHEGVLWP